MYEYKDVTIFSNGLAVNSTGGSPIILHPHHMGRLLLLYLFPFLLDTPIHPSETHGQHEHSSDDSSDRHWFL